jgi:5-methylcytosine-specific restriction endonuclease McrA
MQYVFVLSAIKRPLMPCHPARARQLLRQRKAAVYRRYPFTLILKDRALGFVQPMRVHVDPGSKTTGMAIIVERKRGATCVYGLNLEHRGQAIKDALENRRKLRRARRNRKTRYRQPRFLNRTRRPGWLPPSVQHRVSTAITWLNRFGCIAPIQAVRIELVKFDTQRLNNPLIAGKEYQQGLLWNTEVREYLLELHSRTCQYCHGASGDRYLQVEHINPRSRGGTDSLANLTLACGKCNQRKGRHLPHEWFAELGHKDQKWDDALKALLPKFAEAHEKPRQLKDAAVVNAVRYRLGDYVNSLGVDYSYHPGWETKRNRLDQQYRKDHWIDAACLGAVGAKVLIPPKLKCLTAKAQGHGCRQMVLSDRYGFPRGKPKGPSLVQGFRTGDFVRAEITGRSKYAGKWFGRIAVRTNGNFAINVGTDSFQVNYKYCTRIHSADGYGYHAGTRTVKTWIAETPELLTQALKDSGITKYRVLKKQAVSDGVSETLEYFI